MMKKHFVHIVHIPYDNILIVHNKKCHFKMVLTRFNSLKRKKYSSYQYQYIPEFIMYLLLLVFRNAFVDRSALLYWRRHTTLHKQLPDFYETTIDINGKYRVCTSTYLFYTYLGTPRPGLWFWF